MPPGSRWHTRLAPSKLRTTAGFGGLQSLLGGSGAVISRVISRVAILMTQIRGLITLLITTHEPPSGV